MINTVILKFLIPIVMGAVVAMPEGAQILSAQREGGQVYVYALCNPQAPQVTPRTIDVLPTGDHAPLPEGIELIFISTVPGPNGQGFWHVFERVDAQ